jgi:ABC-type dipeptide/oligopeptide/nickel transport system ATPase subunit
MEEPTKLHIHNVQIPASGRGGFGHHEIDLKIKNKEFARSQSSGCGKSTLLRCCWTDQTYKGDVGWTKCDHTVRGRIEMVFQIISSSLLTVTEISSSASNLACQAKSEKLKFVRRLD